MMNLNDPAIQKILQAAEMLEAARAALSAKEKSESLSDDEMQALEAASAAIEHLVNAGF